MASGRGEKKRTVYTDEAFRSRFVEGERRVHHLGLDLSCPQARPVYTPLAATVRSVEIEAVPLGYGGLIALEHEPEGCPPFITLWGHMAHEAVSRLKPGDRLAAGELVGHMGDMHENGGWTPHLHFQISTDTSLSAAEILGVGESAYLDVWADIFLMQHLLPAFRRKLSSRAGARGPRLSACAGNAFAQPLHFLFRP